MIKVAFFILSCTGLLGLGTDLSANTGPGKPNTGGRRVLVVYNGDISYDNQIVNGSAGLLNLLTSAGSVYAGIGFNFTVELVNVPGNANSGSTWASATDSVASRAALPINADNYCLVMDVRFRDSNYAGGGGTAQAAGTNYVRGDTIIQADVNSYAAYLADGGGLFILGDNYYSDVDARADGFISRMENMYRMINAVAATGIGANSNGFKVGPATGATGTVNGTDFYSLTSDFNALGATFPTWFSGYLASASAGSARPFATMTGQPTQYLGIAWQGADLAPAYSTGRMAYWGDVSSLNEGWAGTASDRPVVRYLENAIDFLFNDTCCTVPSGLCASGPTVVDPADHGVIECFQDGAGHGYSTGGAGTTSWQASDYNGSGGGSFRYNGNICTDTSVFRRTLAAGDLSLYTQVCFSIRHTHGSALSFQMWNQTYGVQIGSAYSIPAGAGWTRVCSTFSGAFATATQLDWRLMTQPCSGAIDIYLDAVSLVHSCGTQPEVVDGVCCSPTSPTYTPTATATRTRTPSPTPTRTPSPSTTATATPSQTPSPSPTPTQTLTRTPTATPSQTPSPSSTPTQTPSRTLTATPTPSPTRSDTPTVTLTRTPTFTATDTITPGPTPTFTATRTATATASPTFSPSDTPSQTLTRTPTSTPSATRTPTTTVTITTPYSPTSTDTATPTATQTVTFSPTDTYSHTPTATRTATQTVTFSPTQTYSHTPTATASATQTVTFSPTQTYSHTPTATPSRTATQTPSATATGTPTRTASPSVTITSTFTVSPTVSPTPIPVPVRLTVSLYNSAGERVRLLFEGGTRSVPTQVSLSEGLLISGANTVSLLMDTLLAGGGSAITWTGQNDGGQLVSSGSYYFKLEFQDPFGATTSFVKGVQVLAPGGTDQVTVFNSAGEQVWSASLAGVSQAAGMTLDAASLVLDYDPANGAPLDTLRISFGGVPALSWDGRDRNGAPVRSGAYVVQMISHRPGGAVVVEAKSVTVLDAGTTKPDLGARIGPNPWRGKGPLVLVYQPYPGAFGMARLYNLAGELVAASMDGDVDGRFELLDPGLAGGVYLLEFKQQRGSAVLGRRVSKVAVVK